MNRYATRVIPLGDWAEQAACQGHPVPDLWFAVNTRDYALTLMAKSICGGCPVRAECLEDALRRGDPDAIAGGMTPRERRALTEGVAA